MEKNKTTDDDFKFALEMPKRALEATRLGLRGQTMIDYIYKEKNSFQKNNDTNKNIESFLNNGIKKPKSPQAA